MTRDWSGMSPWQIEEAVRQAVEQERETCAAVAEEWAQYYPPEVQLTIQIIAEAIRADQQVSSLAPSLERTLSAQRWQVGWTTPGMSAAERPDWVSCSGGTKGQDPMVFLTGHTTDTRYVAELKRLGWGRMMTDRIVQPYEGEPWGWDNGAFVAWNNGLLWDGMEYLSRLESAAALGIPYLAVVPDKVADPDSLRFSLAWLDRVSRYPFPWYLAVQDGMTTEQVRDVLPLFAGLFLGGTKRWKRETARQWAEVAHAGGKRAHYARCSTEIDLRHAQRIGYDSADSTFLLWTRERFAAFASAFGEPDKQMAWGWR